MAANYLHGVETIETLIGARPVQVVKSAVIGLVGIAPAGAKNAITLVQSSQDAVQFGDQLPGFSIPQALDAILDQGAGTVIVVNVFDAATMTSTVTGESKTVTSGKFKTTKAPLSDLVVKKSDNSVTYVAGEDFQIDAYGNATVLDAASMPDATTLTISYKALDSATVTASAINGTIDSGTGARTGMKCFELSYNTFGFVPRIIIAPGYSSLNAVATEMIAVAEKYRAHALIDAPAGITPAAAIAGRGPSGSINFNTSSKRAVLCYPMLKAYSPAIDDNENRPYSQFLAGVIAATDLADGYWFSPSNREIKGITGVERAISAAVNDASTEANLLNEKGIVTVFNSYGTGVRTWGNRSAAFPTSTHPSNFIAVQRTADIMYESLELAMLQFIDQPINNATIDAIKETVNSFIRTLIMRGALVDGRCVFYKDKNPATELAAGHLVFDIEFMPPTPAERITLNAFIDINLLKSLA